MNVVLATDNNFVQHCSVAIASILINNTNVHVFVLTEGLTESNTRIIESLVGRLGGTIDIITVPSDVILKFPMPKESYLTHISVATYYRLLVASLLPSFIDKVIYLDCDIVVRGDLAELYDYDISKMAIAAVYQDDDMWIASEVYGRLMIPKQYGYFNAGVLLINLNYWRENNVEQRLIKYIADNYKSIRFHDQDTLNGVLYKECCALECKWNTLTSFIKKGIYDVSTGHCINYKREVLNNDFSPVIIHFVSRLKPWEFGCQHPYKKEYYKYLSFTDFQGFSPRFQLNKMIIRELVRNNSLFDIIPGVNKNDSYLKI